MAKRGCAYDIRGKRIKGASPRQRVAVPAGDDGALWRPISWVRHRPPRKSKKMLQTSKLKSKPHGRIPKGPQEERWREPGTMKKDEPSHSFTAQGIEARQILAPKHNRKPHGEVPKGPQGAHWSELVTRKRGAPSHSFRLRAKARKTGT